MPGGKLGQCLADERTRGCAQKGGGGSGQGRAAVIGGHPGGGEQDVRAGSDRAGDRRRPAGVRGKPGAGGRREMAGAQGGPSRYRAASRRTAADQQGGGCGGAVRRHRDDRPREAGAGGGQGDGGAGAAAAPVHPGQYRRGRAEGGGQPRRDRCAGQAVPLRASASDRGADVRAADRRGAGAAFCAAGKDRRAQWADGAEHGDERRFRNRHRLRRDACAGRVGDLRRPPGIVVPQWQGKPRRWRPSCTNSWMPEPENSAVAPCSAPTK